MGLTLQTNVGTGMGLSNYFVSMGYFGGFDYSSSTVILCNGGIGSFGATVMTTAFHDGGQPLVYSEIVYLGHQVAVAEFNSFSFLVDAQLSGTVGGKAAGEALVLRPGGTAFDLATFFAEADTLRGNIGNDVLEGYGGADTIIGDAGDDILLGDGSNDTLSGGFGVDLLFGGDGDDQLSGGYGADVIDGGTGIDTACYRDSGAAVTISLLAGTAAGGDATSDTLTSIESLEGSAYNDMLTGDTKANALTGGAGRDVLDGGLGTDVARYDMSAAVTVNLTAGTGRGGDAQGDLLTSIENVVGGGGDDTLIGSAGNNLLVGAGGADKLSGGKGNDVLEGGAGFDTMTGGAGRDIFKLTSLPQAYDNDIINDYQDGVDRISFVGSGITAFDQIRIQDGNGTTFPGSAIVHTSLGDTFLAHTDFTVINASDFIFDTAPAPTPVHAWSADLLTGTGLHCVLA